MPADFYASAVSQAFQKNINLLSDTLKVALLGSSYTPNLGTHVHWSDVSASEITGTGYSAGGMTLSSPSLTVTVANSWGMAWAPSTLFGYGNIVRPSTANGYLYRCAVAGTSGSSAPSWPTVYDTNIVDGGATWACIGNAITVFTSAPVNWPASTFTASYAVIYDAQTAVATTEPLICLQTFTAAQSVSNQTFTLQPDPILGWFVLPLT
jgi:hypothetical protein